MAGRIDSDPTAPASRVPDASSHAESVGSMAAGWLELTDEQVRGILGENLMRVFRTVWDETNRGAR